MPPLVARLAIYIVVLRAHPVRDESHNQRNATGEVVIKQSPFSTHHSESAVMLLQVSPSP